MKFLLSTVRGLENLAAEDIKENFGLNIDNTLFGKVIVDGNEKDAVVLNYAARSIHKVYMLLFYGEISGLEDIKKAFDSIDWSKYIPENYTFGIEAKRVGRHNFSSRDIAIVGGSSILDQLKGKTRVYLNDPDIKVYAEVNRNLLFIGIDTTGESLHIRGFRRNKHIAPMKASLAYLMFKFAEINNELILDPFLGSGTICIEYALWKNEIPHLFRTFRFERIPYLNQYFDEIKEKFKPRIKDVLFAKGFDINEKYVHDAIKNAEAAYVKKNVYFYVGDARNEDSYEYANVIITNPPYGTKMGRKFVLEAIYREFFRAAKENGFSSIYAMISEPYFIKAGEKAGYIVEKKTSIVYGSLPSLLVKFTL